MASTTCSPRPPPVGEMSNEVTSDHAGPLLRGVRLNEVAFDRERFALHLANSLELQLEGRAIVTGSEPVLDQLSGNLGLVPGIEALQCRCDLPVQQPALAPSQALVEVLLNQGVAELVAGFPLRPDLGLALFHQQPGLPLARETKIPQHESQGNAQDQAGGHGVGADGDGGADGGEGLWIALPEQAKGGDNAVEDIAHRTAVK